MIVNLQQNVVFIDVLYGVYEQKTRPKARFCLLTGGEGGIRTRGGFYPTHAFQACDLNHSSTSPVANDSNRCEPVESKSGKS